MRSMADALRPLPGRIPKATFCRCMMVVGFELLVSPAFAALAFGQPSPATPSASSSLPPSSPTPSNPAPSPPIPSNPPLSNSTPSSTTPANANTPTLPISRSDRQGLDLLTQVLPCGLRVVIAQDRSLAVAATVWALESGTRDDPPDLPGLVHALAIHSHQGNRHLAPGAVLDAVHHTGGWTSSAVGLGQVRFESVFPAQHFDEVLSVQAKRLRGLSLDAGLWLESLRAASQDGPLQRPVSARHRALVWRESALEHNGRQPARALVDVAPQMLAQHAAKLFGLPRSTLVVVTPNPPSQVLQEVTAAFADAPPQVRAIPVHPLPPAAGQATIVYEAPKKGKVGDHQETWLWPIPAGWFGPASAAIICPILARPFDKTVYPGVVVRCTVDDDHRAGALRVDTRGEMAAAAVQERVQQILQGNLPAPLANDLQRESSRWLNQRRAQLNAPLSTAIAIAKLGEHEFTQPFTSTAAPVSGESAANPPVQGSTGNPGPQSVAYRDWSGEQAIAMLGQSVPASFVPWLAPAYAVRVIAAPPPTGGSNEPPNPASTPLAPSLPAPAIKPGNEAPPTGATPAGDPSLTPRPSATPPPHSPRSSSSTLAVRP